MIEDSPYIIFCNCESFSDPPCSYSGDHYFSYAWVYRYSRSFRSLTDRWWSKWGPQPWGNHYD